METLSLLYRDTCKISDDISIVIPSVRDVIEDEENYYSLVSMITSMPIDMMVALDDIGIDFSTINEYDLFLLLFNAIRSRDTRLIFGDLDLSKFVLAEHKESGMTVLLDPESGARFDRIVHGKAASVLRTIHHLEKNTKRPGNEAAREYMIRRAREKQSRRKNKERGSQLEPLIISMVNTEQFKYDYESVLDLSIYQFNQSVRQIIKKIDYDNRMHGVYAGTIDASKLGAKELSWLHEK